MRVYVAMYYEDIVWAGTSLREATKWAENHLVQIWEKGKLVGFVAEK